MHLLRFDYLACKVTAPVDPHEWVQLAYVGKFHGHPMGDFEITADHITAMVANFKADPRGRVVVDYEHQTLWSRDNGRPAPAAGWLVECEARDVNTTLWGKIEWTESASTSIRAGEYSYLSPVIQWKHIDRMSGTSAGTRLHSVALTNTPFLDRLPAVAATDTAPMNPELLQMLGLSEADSGKALTALQRLVRLAKVGEHALSTAKLNPELDATAACAALTPILGHAGYIAQGAHDDVVRQLSEAKSGATVEQLLGEAREKGVIVPATETWARDFARRDSAGFKTWLSAAPRVGPEPAKTRTNTNSAESQAIALSETDKSVMASLGLTEDQFRKALAARKEA